MPNKMVRKIFCDNISQRSTQILIETMFINKRSWHHQESPNTVGLKVEGFWLKLSVPVFRTITKKSSQPNHAMICWMRQKLTPTFTVTTEKITSRNYIPVTIKRYEKLGRNVSHNYSVGYSPELFLKPPIYPCFQLITGYRDTHTYTPKNNNPSVDAVGCIL